MRTGPVPQRTVREHITEGAKNRRRTHVRKVAERKPIGHHPALGEPFSHEGEVLTRVRMLNADNAWRRRFSGNQIESLLGRLQKVPAVLDVHAHPRIPERMLRCVRIDDAVQLEDVARKIDDVDRLETARIDHCLRRVAHSVANQQRMLQVRMHGHRPVHVQLHVAARAVARR